VESSVLKGIMWDSTEKRGIWYYKELLKNIPNIQSVETIKVFTTKPCNSSSKSSEILLTDALKFWDTVFIWYFLFFGEIGHNPNIQCKKARLSNAWRYTSAKDSAGVQTNSKRHCELCNLLPWSRPVI